MKSSSSAAFPAALARTAALGIVALATLGLGAPPAVAQLLLLGDAQQVNQVSVGRQLNAKVAALGNGDLVVVWEGEDSDGRGIFARRIGPGGVPVGNEFQVSVTEVDDQVSADVAGPGDGSFVVVWKNDTIGVDPSISSRRYDSADVPSGEVDVAPGQAEMDVFSPHVERIDAGHYVVVWESYDSVEDEAPIRARLLDTNGSVDGASFDLESAPGAGEFYGSAGTAPRAVGGFVLAWRTSENGTQHLARRYDTAAAGVGSTVVIGPAFGGSDPSVASLESDGFVVGWEEGGNDLKTRRVAANGTLDSVHDVTASTDRQTSTDAVGLPGDRMALVWHEDPQSNPSTIRLQILGADDMSEAEIEIDETTGFFGHPRVAYDASRAELAVVWNRRAGDTDQEDVFLRRIALDALFGDGFESGNTQAWD